MSKVFTRRKNIFFETFVLIAENLAEAARYFKNNVCATNDLAEFAGKMKDFEGKGDEYTHTIFKAVNKTFVTPLEREDILSLTVKLDDILDGLEECAALIEIYGLRECFFITALTQMIDQATLEIKQAIELLVNKKFGSVPKHTHAVNKFENEADYFLRNGLKHLFQNSKDPIEIIKKKEIYEKLEDITDVCEDVANILESIIVRNS
ncbi:MAG: DUF47 domain-containing protein [Peptococcaceae bacterium]|nr:DUF47 domain-containing protein [Peptococcaceae bacterium]